jgi:hypothetical protein
MRKRHGGSTSSRAGRQRGRNSYDLLRRGLIARQARFGRCSPCSFLDSPRSTPYQGLDASKRALEEHQATQSHRIGRHTCGVAASCVYTPRLLGCRSGRLARPADECLRQKIKGGDHATSRSLSPSGSRSGVARTGMACDHPRPESCAHQVSAVTYELTCSMGESSNGAR